MNYEYIYILKEKVGNNAFSYDIREDKTLTIPSLIGWSLEDVKIGGSVVFEEYEDGILKSCTWLENFVQLTDYPTLWPITVFDNHNHALYFWLEAIRDGIIKPGFELIHIDEHSDLWANEYTLDRERAIYDKQYAWEFTNHSCNVGNYISPALSSGVVGKMIRIENEYELDRYSDYTPSENSVLNLDLDFFSPEMDFIDEKKKLKCIRNLMKKVKCITIATSPYFIDQWLALEKLQYLMTEKRYKL